jgi:hypothetical protein
VLCWSRGKLYVYTSTVPPLCCCCFLLLLCFAFVVVVAFFLLRSVGRSYSTDVLHMYLPTDVLIYCTSSVLVIRYDPFRFSFVRYFPGVEFSFSFIYLVRSGVVRSGPVRSVHASTYILLGCRCRCRTVSRNSVSHFLYGLAFPFRLSVCLSVC